MAGHKILNDACVLGLCCQNPQRGRQCLTLPWDWEGGEPAFQVGQVKAPPVSQWKGSRDFYENVTPDN